MQATVTVIFVRSILFFLILSLSMRLMGKRQIGEIELTEFVTALMLSELAALPVTDTDIPLTHGLVAAAVLVSLEVIVAFVCRKSPRIRRLLDGSPLVLVAKGKVKEQSLTAARISTDELFAAVRGAGLRGMEEVSYVILEQTGTLSVIPKSACAPLAAETVGLKPPEQGICHVLVVDGVLQNRALEDSGRNKAWFSGELKRRGLKKKRLLYFSVDDDGNVSFEEKAR